MLIIIGGSGYRKQDVAQKLANGRKVICAGQWVRELTGRTHHTNEGSCTCWRCSGATSAPDMVSVTVSELQKNPHVALDYIRGQIPADRNVIVEGFRNPSDFLAVIQPGDHVLDVGGPGTSTFEIDGLKAIRATKDFLQHLGVTWTDYKRYFAPLPEPIVVALPKDFLTKEWCCGTVPGKIMALESYEGSRVTAMWKSDDGGTYHDVPLEQILTDSYPLYMDDFREYARVQQIVKKTHCYSLAGKGPAIVEMSPVEGAVQVFNEDREYIGVGKSLGMVHWPEDNVLLHLIDIDGRLLLWPPHKLMFGDAKSLPNWKKNKTIS